MFNLIVNLIQFPVILLIFSLAFTAFSWNSNQIECTLTDFNDIYHFTESLKRNLPPPM